MVEGSDFQKVMVKEVILKGSDTQRGHGQRK
jgi:hypothetical protein